MLYEVARKREEMMQYIDGFIAAVPTENKQQYIEHAEQKAAVFKRHGALKLVENWGDDVPDGEVTSMLKAVQCKPDETVFFSWVIWPSKDARNKGMKALQSDPDMAAIMMPFDGKRLIFGGFETILET